MTTKNINLSLTVQETDYIARVLGQRPWAEVNSLLNKIEHQANDPALQRPFPTIITPENPNDTGTPKDN